MSSARYVIRDAAKRALDLSISTLLLTLLLPVIVLCAVAIRLESPGPAFYRSTRVGLRGRPFCMLKFRKMRDGVTGPPLTGAHDERFTWLGRALAASKLDEIPQLWNVLKGDMSLVGPRPEDPIFVAANRDAFEPILRIRPGITGLSQLAFAHESEILDHAAPEERIESYLGQLLPQKIGLDTLYATSRSFAMDVRILCWTAFVVLLGGEVAVNRRSGALHRRLRPPVQRQLVGVKEKGTTW